MTEISEELACKMTSSKITQIGKQVHIDHLLLRVSGSLSKYCECFEKISGVKPAVGGRHIDLGNYVFQNYI